MAKDQKQQALRQRAIQERAASLGYVLVKFRRRWFRKQKAVTYDRARFEIRSTASHSLVVVLKLVNSGVIEHFYNLDDVESITVLDGKVAAEVLKGGGDDASA